MFRHSTVEYLPVDIDGTRTYKWVVELFHLEERVAVHYYDDRQTASLHSERFIDGVVDI
jgi:hypothetical protein